MKKTLFLQNHHSYVVRPNLIFVTAGLIYSCVLIWFSLKEGHALYQVFAGIGLLWTLLQLLRYLLPSRLVITENQILLPGLFPNHERSLNFHQIEGAFVFKVKGTPYLLIRLKNKETIKLNSTEIKDWEKCFKKILEIVPSLDERKVVSASPVRLAGIGLFFFAVLVAATHSELIDEKNGILTGRNYRSVFTTASFNEEKIKSPSEEGLWF
jgi:hypothetical protein